MVPHDCSRYVQISIMDIWRSPLSFLGFLLGYPWHERKCVAVRRISPADRGSPARSQDCRGSLLCLDSREPGRAADRLVGDQDVVYVRSARWESWPGRSSSTSRRYG